MAKVTLNLECKLTPEEIQNKSHEMATAVIQYNEYETEKKAIAKDLGDKMKDLHSELTKLARITRRGAVNRPVECSVELNVPEVGTRRIVRLDNGVTIQEIPMTDAERQTNLFDEVDQLEKMFNLPEDPEAPAAE